MKFACALGATENSPGLRLEPPGHSQRVASAVVFLASEAASFITGQTLSVSGGYTMM